MIGAAAGTLVHAHHVHAGGQPFFGDAQHVIRFRRSFQSVHHDYRERRMTIDLPMTMAEHVNTGLNLDQALFGLRQHDSSRQKKTRDGLHVAAA